MIIHQIPKLSPIVWVLEVVILSFLVEFVLKTVSGLSSSEVTKLRLLCRLWCLWDTGWKDGPSWASLSQSQSVASHWKVLSHVNVAFFLAASLRSSLIGGFSNKEQMVRRFQRFFFTCCLLFWIYRTLGVVVYNNSVVCFAGIMQRTLPKCRLWQQE